MQIEKLPLLDVPAAQQLVNAMLLVGADKHPVLVELRRDVFYGGSVWVGYKDKLPVSMICAKVGKRQKNKWEPLLNWYSAYTLPHMRRNGYATELYRAVERDALASGCRRGKSLAGSAAGLALHRKLNQDCWGMTAANEVFVNWALPGHESLYSKSELPPQTPGPRMSTQTIVSLIKKGLRYDS